MKALIIGGVAAGASVGPRLRRLDENAEIIIIQKGPYISYAACGMPYHIGGVIPNRSELVIMTPERMVERDKIDVRVNSEAISIDRDKKEVAIKGPDGVEYRESYDKLVLATGSSPVVPPLPGVSLPGVCQLWNIPDMDKLIGMLEKGAKRAVVVGAGFVGIEVAENLVHRGVQTALVELLPQVLPTLDSEMAAVLSKELKRMGVELRLGRGVKEIRRNGEALAVALDDGQELPADLVLLSVGVRPNSQLAAAAGLTLGERGQSRVAEELRTRDPDLDAAGDVIEVRDPILGGYTAVPLAGPANKQGRMVADNIAGGMSRYFGSFGASILKLGEYAAASVGLTERRLKQTNLEYHKVHLHPGSNAGYYPGGSPIFMKLLFDSNGRIFGGQMVGKTGVDKRIDVLATAMRAGMTVDDLVDLELSYAPPFNSPKDPVNVAGMVASNVLVNRTRMVCPKDPVPENAILLDVRENDEYAAGSLDGAKHIPLGQLRDRLGELDKTRPIVIFCLSGLRAYVAERVLRQNGFQTSSFSGGLKCWQEHHPEEKLVIEE